MLSLSAESRAITNIGAAATDFTATGGLNLGGDLAFQQAATISTTTGNLTLNPSGVVNVTKAGVPLYATTTADTAAYEEALRIVSDRVTPTDSDQVGIGFYLDNATPTSLEYARITVMSRFVAVGSEEGRLLVSVYDPTVDALTQVFQVFYDRQQVNRSFVGGDLFMGAENSDNTNAASHASVRAIVGGASAGDPYIIVQIPGGQEIVIGLDNSDSDALVISDSTAIGTNNRFRLVPAGDMQLLPAGVVASGKKFYPATDADALQSAAGLYAGTGAPNNANGANGDFYFRSDGGSLTTLYQRRAGAWVGVI